MKKLGLDLDSVLADIMVPLNNFINRKYKTDYQLNDYKDFGLWKVWNISQEESIDRVYDFYESDYMNKILPMTGSVTAIKYLAKKTQLVVITSRPQITFSITEKWIKQYFPGKIAKVIHTNQYAKIGQKSQLKSQVAKAENISVMIEDHWEYAWDCANAGIKVLLMTMPWNKREIKHRNIIKVSNWPEAVFQFDKISRGGGN